MDTPEITTFAPLRPHITVPEILAHPNFQDARKLYIDRFLALYTGDPFLARLLIETSRFCIYKIIVVMEAGQVPDRRETWLTVGRLKETLCGFGLGSARQVDHLLARLQETGFIALTPSEADKRVRLLQATERLLAHDRDWLAAHHAPLEVICPQNDYSRVMQGDPDFQRALHRASVNFMALGAELLASMPEMGLFFTAAAGHLILAELLQAALAEPELGHAAIAYSSVGERFGVSRTHVRKVLTTAEEAGLLKLESRGGRRVQILPRLWECYDRSIAGGMYFHDVIYAEASNRPFTAPEDFRATG